MSATKGAMTQQSYAEAILRCHPTAVVAIDRARRVCYANRAARQLLGTADTAVEGRDVVELFDGDQQLARTIDQASSDGEERRIRLDVVRGPSRIALGLTLSSHTSSKSPWMLILTFRNLEERKHLDERDVQLERQAVAERLVGGFAHQLRNPLAAISALAENLDAETAAEDPRAEYISRLLKQVGRMERLIRSCIEFGTDTPVMRERVAAERIGRRAGEAFTARCGTSLRCSIEPGIGDVVVCEEQILRSLAVLLDTTVGASGDADAIELRVTAEAVGDIDRFVCFVVSSRASGLEEADLAKLFEPFYTTRARPMGIGLAAAQELALQNGGAVEVRSASSMMQLILRLRAAERAAPIDETGGRRTG